MLTWRVTHYTNLVDNGEPHLFLLLAETDGGKKGTISIVVNSRERPCSLSCDLERLLVLILIPLFFHEFFFA